MDALAWIVGSGLLMVLIAGVGSIALLFRDATLRAMLLPLVALAAGALIGGAFFHLIPNALESIGNDTTVWLVVLAGFTSFLLLEQLLHWHRGHATTRKGRRPLTYLILLGDGLHNFIGGAAIAGTFLIDIRLGIASWLAAAMHEVPQELGDFAVLVHGGWSRRAALAFNMLSALLFLAGGLLTYAASATLDVAYLVPFAAGNFLYLGATDLVPEVNKSRDLAGNMLHLVMFLAGVFVLFAAGMIG